MWEAAGKLGGMAGRGGGADHYAVYTLHCQVENSCFETRDFVFMSAVYVIDSRTQLFALFFGPTLMFLFVFC